MKYEFFVKWFDHTISALPLQDQPLTVNKLERVTLQTRQAINDIKTSKWFIHDINGKLISIQPANKRYKEGTHDNPSLTICSVGLKDSTINYVCIVLHKDDRIESFKWRLRVIPQGMWLYNYRNILYMIIQCTKKCCLHFVTTNNSLSHFILVLKMLVTWSRIVVFSCTLISSTNQTDIDITEIFFNWY